LHFIVLDREITVNIGQRIVNSSNGFNLKLLGVIVSTESVS
jgi:hypothetical protein